MKEPYKQCVRNPNNKYRLSKLMSLAQQIPRGQEAASIVRGQVDESIKHYQRALDLRDGNAAAHFGLGRALGAKQKTDAAIFHFQKALGIQPDYIAASNDLGVLFASKGELKEAIDELSLYLKLQPNAADASRVAKDLQEFRAQLHAIQALSAQS